MGTHHEDRLYDVRPRPNIGVWARRVPTGPVHLSTLHRNMLTAIAGYQRRWGRPPYYREIGALLGKSGSTATITEHVRRLHDRGLIHRTPRVRHGIVLLVEIDGVTTADARLPDFDDAP